MDMSGPFSPLNPDSYECVFVCTICKGISSDPFCTNNCVVPSSSQRTVGANLNLNHKPLLCATIPQPQVVNDLKKKATSVRQAYMCCVCGRESIEPVCGFEHDITVPVDKCTRCGTEFESIAEEMRHDCKPPSIQTDSASVLNSESVVSTILSLPENLASLVQRGFLGTGQYQVITLSEERLMQEMSNLQNNVLEWDDGPEVALTNFNLDKVKVEFVPVVEDNVMDTLGTGSIVNKNTSHPIQVKHEEVITSKDMNKTEHPLQEQRNIGKRPSMKLRQYLRCSECGQQFQSVELLIAHLEMHAGLQDFECQFCLRNYRRLYYFRAHLESHASLLPIVCAFCDEAFLHPEEHSHHLLTVHGVIERDMRQLMSTKNEAHPKHHEMAKERNVDKAKHPKLSSPPAAPAKSPTKPVHIFECNICSVLIPTIEEVQAHLSNHANNPLYKCELCDKRFSTADSLKRHNCPVARRAAASGADSEDDDDDDDGASAHWCDSCGKTFSNAAGLACHRKSAHLAKDQQKQFECERCPMKFRFLSEMLIHRARCH